MRTVAFLFTDVEGSTPLWEKHPDAMSGLMARHNAIISSAVKGRRGVVFKTVGDGFCSSFETVGDALACAVDAQRALIREEWGDTPIVVRMGVHAGAATYREGDYEGLALSRSARVLSSAHGGQVLVSEAASALAADSLPDGCALLPIGAVKLRGIERPEHVYQLTHPDLPSVFPALSSLAETPTNVIAPATTFVGRENDLEQLRACLDSAKIVTIVGTAGCGKSRLALQYAVETLSSYPGGVWHVDIESSHEEIPRRVGEVLGVRIAGPQPVAEIAEHLDGGKVLFVFDNCEARIHEVLALAEELTIHQDGVRVLATSREPLGAPGEQLMPLRPLELPARTMVSPVRMLERSPAVRLFVERATAQSPSFRLDADNCEIVAEICRQLDGIPLAIELTAPKIRIMSPKDLLRRLNTRLKAAQSLANPVRRADPMRDALDWSFTSLAPHSRALLENFIVFKRGWTLEAAETVCTDDLLSPDDVLDELTSLVDKSLVNVTDQNDVRRFSLLRNVSDYIVDSRTGADEALENRHALYYSNYVTGAAQESGGDPSKLFDALEVENANITAAFDHYLATGHVTQAAEMASALWQWWIVRGHLAQGWSQMSALLTAAGDLTAAMAPLAMAAGLIASELGNYAAASAKLGQAVSIFRETGPPRYLAAALGNLALIDQQQKSYDRAVRLYEECLDVYRTVESNEGIAMVLGNLALIYTLIGDYEQADARAQEAIQMSRALGLERSLAVALGNFGLLQIERRENTAAAATYLECTPIFIRTGDKGGYASCVDALARIATASGISDDAARLTALADALRRETQIRLPGWEEAVANDIRDQLSRALPAAQYDLLRVEGRELEQGDVLAIAKALSIKAH
ncbi:MAG TPA: tetratricopeptide repeat protein [Capsulimonadaceae bacterium]|jgi:predicted ATPase/class 3 adenylate cyclase